MVQLSAFYPMTNVTMQLAQWQTLAPNYLGDGVLAGQLNQCSVIQSTPAAMTVGVNTGRCMVQGVLGINGTLTTLAIAAADATNPRIDRVVMRVDTVANDSEVLVLTGNPAASPVAAALIRSATQTDYSLAQVLVGTTVTTIVTANITDERSWASFRGIPLRATQIASSGTINPFGPSPLTEGHLWCQVTGTTTIANVSPGANPPQSGGLLLLEFQSAGCTVNATGNIKVPRSYASGTATGALLALMWDGTQWVEVSRSGEQLAGGTVLAGPAGTAAGLMTARALVLGDFPTATQNTVLAGPPTGTAAGAITARALVAADLPVYGTFAVASLFQGGSLLTFTTTAARFTQFGKTAIIYVNLAITLTSGLTGAIVVTLPAALAMGANQQTIGQFTYNDISVTIYAGSVIWINTTTLEFLASGNGGFLGATPAFAVANGDSISFMITPELA